MEDFCNPVVQVVSDGSEQEGFNVYHLKLYRSTNILDWRASSLCLFMH